MKQLELKSRLDHIVTACERVLQFTHEKSFEEYTSDVLVSSGVERQLAIIGEAVSKLASIDRSTAAALGDYAPIISFRNQLVHNYPNVDHAAVWLIIHRDVPLLLERARTLLDSPDPGPTSA